MMAAKSVYHKDFTGVIVGPDGVERYYIRGAYGRVDDLPSIIHPDGTRIWFKENPKRGLMGQSASYEHREGDKPAVIRANGDQVFFKFGKLHRDGVEPAVILFGVGLKWFRHGECIAYQLNGLEKVDLTSLPD